MDSFLHRSLQAGIYESHKNYLKDSQILSIHYIRYAYDLASDLLASIGTKFFMSSSFPVRYQLH